MAHRRLGRDHQRRHPRHARTASPAPTRKLPQEVKAGDRLLIDDGKVAVEVTGVDGNDIRCLVIEGGPVSNNKGVSLPNVAVSVPAHVATRTPRTCASRCGLGVDLVALSFVRSPDDIKLVHEIMDEEGMRRPGHRQGREARGGRRTSRRSCCAFDGVMVARGDLGVELPLDQVPLVQKRAVQLCRENAKPVIVATQMLDSMIENSRPTRAEASDVANAVLDGADAVMLSGETSVGKYPVLTVSTMAKIVTHHRGRFASGCRGCSTTRVPAVARSPWPPPQIARAIGAKALVAFSQTGDTVRRLARLHCELPLLRVHPGPRGAQPARAVLGRGDLPDAVRRSTPTTCSARSTRRCSASAGPTPGDYVVIVAGSPPGTPGSTNTLRVHQLGSLSTPRRALSDRGRPAVDRPRSTSCSSSSTSSSVDATTVPGREPAGRPAAGLRRAGRRPGAGRRRAHRRPGAVRALAARLLRAARRPGRADRVTRWRTSATGGRSRSAARWRRSTASRSSSCRRRSSAPRTAWTTRPRPRRTCPARTTCRRWPTGWPATRSGSASGRRSRRPIDVRYVGEPGWVRPGDRPADPHQRVWMRIDGKLPDDPLLHACALTYASDLTLLDSVLSVHGEVWGPGGMVGASLDHALWFHRPFRADEWFLYDCWSPSASGARGLATGRLFTRGRPAHRQRRPGGPAAPRRRVTRQRRRPTARHLREQKATRQVPTGRPVRSC